MSTDWVAGMEPTRLHNVGRGACLASRCRDHLNAVRDDASHQL